MGSDQVQNGAYDVGRRWDVRRCRDRLKQGQDDEWVDEYEGNHATAIILPTVPLVLLDAAAVPIDVHTLITAVGSVFSLMLAFIVWLLQRGYEAEKKLMVSAIEDAKATAKSASDNLLKQIELRHEQEIKMQQFSGTLKYLQADIEELQVKDSEQNTSISKLKERLDRGARTFSQQMPVPREDPASDPPPVRPRLKSRSTE